MKNLFFILIILIFVGCQKQELPYPNVGTVSQLNSIKGNWLLTEAIQYSSVSYYQDGSVSNGIMDYKNSESFTMFEGTGLLFDSLQIGKSVWEINNNNIVSNNYLYYYTYKSGVLDISTPPTKRIVTILTNNEHRLELLTTTQYTDITLGEEQLKTKLIFTK